MSRSEEEIEAKFCLRRLPALLQRLEEAGAQCIVPRSHEYNLRFDTPDRRLAARKQVLRLRHLDETRLTFKAPGQSSQGVRARTELEVSLSDFETAKKILLALGYQIFWIYEKYRAIYRWEEALITVDETPLGNFTEIEAASPSAVLQYARRLGLEAEAAIPLSYHELFRRAAARMDAPPRDLTFAAFAGQIPAPETLGIRCAD